MLVKTLVASHGELLQICFRRGGKLGSYEENRSVTDTEAARREPPGVPWAVVAVTCCHVLSRSPIFSCPSALVPCSVVRLFSSLRVTCSGHECCSPGSAPLPPAAPQAPVFPRACRHLLRLWGHRIGRKNAKWGRGTLGGWPVGLHQSLPVPGFSTSLI